MKETINSFIKLGDKVIEQEEEIERLNKGIKTILDIADKEKILVEEKWSSGGEHKEFYEVTFDYDFLKSILVGSDKSEYISKRSKYNN